MVTDSEDNHLNNRLLILLAVVLVELGNSWLALVVEYKNCFDHSKKISFERLLNNEFRFQIVIFSIQQTATQPP